MSEQWAKKAGEIEPFTRPGHDREVALAILSQASHRGQGSTPLNDIQVQHLLVIGYRAGHHDGGAKTAEAIQDYRTRRLNLATKAIEEVMRHRRRAVRWMLVGIPTTMLYAWLVLEFGRSVFASIVLGLVILCGLQLQAHRTAMGVWEEINRG